MVVFLAACGQDTKDIEVKEEENQHGENVKPEEEVKKKKNPNLNWVLAQIRYLSKKRLQ